MIGGLWTSRLVTMPPAAMQEFPLLDLRDPVCSGTHLFTSLLAFFGTLLMRRLTRDDALRRACVTIFGFSMVILYAASGLFHGLQLPRSELRVYQQLDQSAIYVLIAGTCTPVMGILLTGRIRKTMLWSVWLMAVTGIGCMWLLPKAPHSLTVSIYLGMGWLGLAPIWQYYRAVGLRAIGWALWGAAFYTFGAICELTKWPVILPGVIQSHEVLHLCDMAGTFCHFVFVVRYVIPYVAGTDDLEPAELLAAPIVSSALPVET
jgi:hemolysin III